MLGGFEKTLNDVNIVRPQFIERNTFQALLNLAAKNVQNIGLNDLFIEYKKKCLKK